MPSSGKIDNFLSYIMPESVTLDNFLSVEHAEFSYKNRGLVLIDGPTGSGKSGLFVESLCWGLFGQPIRDISPDDVVNRFIGKNCHVGVTLTTARHNRDTGLFEPDPDGVKAVVHSYRKHASGKDGVTFEIWQNGKKIDDRTGNRTEQTRENIVKYLDMDYTAFTNSVVFSQSIAKYFSGLTDKSQKEIVERLLGIGWIPEVYEVAKADVTRTNAELQTALKDFDATNEALKEARNAHKSTKLNYDNFEAEKRVRIDNLSRESAKLEIKDLSEYERLVAEGEAAMVAIGARIAGASAKKELSEINLKIGAARERRDGILREVGKCQAKARSLESLSADTECDKCGQPIKEASKKSYAKKLADETAVAQDEHERFASELRTLQEQAGEIGKRVRAEDGQETERLTLERELRTVKKSYEDVRLENAKVEEKKNSILARVELVKSEQNAYKPLIDTLEKKISELEKTKERLEAAYTRLAEELDYHKFWEVGYSNKGLKSLLMDSVVPRMNRSAYTYSKIFGDMFSISFNTQSSTKKGDIREKFAVEVDNRVGSSSYYGNSEGEKRTIDTIVMFVLGDLAAERSSRRFSILVLDDVFEKLDEELCTSVINVLAAMTTPNSVLMPNEDEADDYIRMLARLPKRDSIFVLTHLEYFKSKFENKVRVGKADGNTRFW